MKIKDPSGQVWNLPTSVATGLAGGVNSKWELVGDEKPSDGGDTGTTPELRYPEGEPTDKWTVPQLKAFAADHAIDLGSATKKPDIFAAVKEHPVTSAVKPDPDHQADDEADADESDEGGATGAAS
jgi:hypothetical protein